MSDTNTPCARCNGTQKLAMSSTPWGVSYRVCPDCQTVCWECKLRPHAKEHNLSVCQECWDASSGARKAASYFMEQRSKRNKIRAGDMIRFDSTLNSNESVHRCSACGEYPERGGDVGVKISTFGKKYDFAICGTCVEKIHKTFNTPTNNDI